jgi:hypothetical protein
MLIFLSMVLGGCGSVRSGIKDDPITREEGRRLADRAVVAHGGMERWRALGGVRLHLHNDGPFHIYPDESDWLFDPASNRGRMRATTKKGTVEYRFDGQHAVILENGRCTGSRRERAKAGGLVSNILFWFGVPFKFRDPGAHVVAAPAAPLSSGAPPSSRYLVTYRNVGQTPDDWFLVWLDPASDRVAKISYVASGYSRSLELDGEWQRYRQVEGLAVVERRVHRPRNRLLRGLVRPFVQEISNVVVQQPVSDADFAAPAGCIGG